MKEISLKPVEACEKIFRMLEKKGLIRAIKPSKKALLTKTKTGTVDVFTRQKRVTADTGLCVSANGRILSGFAAITTTKILCF